MKEMEQRTAAKKFAAFWNKKGDEKGESQKFWLSLLRDVFGVEHPEEYIEFEDRVFLGHTSFIDGYIPETKVLIEQKALGKDLNKAIKQSDGTLLTPFQQAKRYITELPLSKHPRWVVTCNFEKFLVYDMEQPGGDPEEIFLENLEKEYYRLQFLVDDHNAHLKKEMDISIEAGKIVGLLYDAFLKEYKNPESVESLHSLNVLCVRLVFCLYAEDAGIFGRRGMFHDYLERFSTRDMRRALINLFEVLDTKMEDRDPYLEDDLATFPYVNGGLFSDEKVEIPHFTDDIRELVLVKASEDFDWSEISPTIFGAVFESTLNPETRRSGGMHYTSIENIHKVIDPLFLEELQEEFALIKGIKTVKQQKERLERFQNKLADLKWLDPACGSGNFLTETFISIRRLENQVIALQIALERGQMEGQMVFGDVVNPIQVSIQQFYGLEINDFAVTVAKTAMWIAESQMLKETEDIIHMSLDFLPLKSYVNIVEGNALQINWEDVVPKDELNYIMGNPPFVGARLMGKKQKEDLFSVFGKKWKNAGNLDYVSCWYKKSCDLMSGTTIKAALVSTNSIAQGESVSILWKPLFENGLHIDFAHKTFQWDSEANIKAHVHCIIIGCSTTMSNKEKIIYSSGRPVTAKNINGYLLDADNVFIEKRKVPLCNVPLIGIGNMPVDGGNYLFSEKEKEEFIKKEPLSKMWFRPWIGSDEFINQYYRYCLYLKDCPPEELRKMKECLKVVERVRDFRSQSTRTATKKMAEYPLEFSTTNIPKSNYIVIPKVSSEKRRYIPMGYLTPNVLSSDLVFIIDDAKLYHFGVLTSNVHMAWVRTVAGRLETRYRYSKDIVYNNFPWPEPTAAQKEKIEQTAQAILDARAKYPDSSLADLYDELAMPPELRKAHQANDKAVMAAYGWKSGDEAYCSEAGCVAELMKMYQKLTED